MQLFHEIADGVVILRSRGVFRQAKVFRRDDKVYAQYGAGFIRLLSHSGTSVPSVAWLDLEADGVDASRAPRWTGAE